MLLIHLTFLWILLPYEGVTFDLDNGLDLNDLSLFGSKDKDLKLSDIFSMDTPRENIFRFEDLPKLLTTYQQKLAIKKPAMKEKLNKETLLKTGLANSKILGGARKNMLFEKKPKSKEKVAKSTATFTSTTPMPQVYHQNPGNVQCCNAVTCFNPCPYPSMPLPMYQVSPIVVPARSYFEPVIHDHPPLEEIKRMIKSDKRKKKKQIYTSTSLEEEYSDTSSSERDSFEFYNDFIHMD